MPRDQSQISHLVAHAQHAHRERRHELRFSERVGETAARLAAVEKEVAKLSNLVVQEARFEERLMDIARRVDRLESALHKP